MTEKEPYKSRIDWDNFQAGQTVPLNRQEILRDSLEGLQDEVEQGLGVLLKTLAADANIGGVGLSNIKRSGGIYTHIFCVDMQDQEAMKKTLQMVGQAHNSLEGSGPCSFVNLGSKQFDEVEGIFRRNFSEGDPNNVFFPTPHTEELDLIGIIKFE